MHKNAIGEEVYRPPSCIHIHTSIHTYIHLWIIIGKKCIIHGSSFLIYIHL